MKIHGEPARGRSSRCGACGLPLNDPLKARQLTEMAEDRDPAQTWTWCFLCGRETCKLLKQLCAEEIEREVIGESGS